LEEEIKDNTKIKISEEEKQNYDILKLQLEDLEKEKELNINDLENIEKLKSITFIKENIDYELLVILDEKRKTTINNKYNELKSKFKEDLNTEVSEIKKSIIERNSEIDKGIKIVLDNDIYKKV
jgi:hypothetical protein